MVRGVAKAAVQRVYARWARLPLTEAVLLEAFQGASTSGDPGAIARYLLDNTDLPIIWARPDSAPSTDRVKVVRYRSASYFKALATTKYLVNNVTFPALFSKRDEQVYLNTWHGTPLKRMGRDIDAPYREIANTIDNLQAADIVLSSGEYMTRTMFDGAYGVTAGVVETGTPRVDCQFGGKPELILYAPTWQEASYTQAADDTEDLVTRMQALSEVAPVALRVHSKVVARVAADPRLAPFLVEGDTNDLLGRSRVLITDYSSVAFDFLATGSHVLFYTPTPYPRGVYLTDDELPGPRTDSLEQLVAWVADPPPTDIAAMRRRFVPNEDGKATQRVVELLLSH